MTTKPFTPQEIIERLAPNEYCPCHPEGGENAVLMERKQVRIGEVIEYLVETSTYGLWDDIKKLVILWEKKPLWKKSLQEIEQESGYEDYFCKNGTHGIEDSNCGLRHPLCAEKASRPYLKDPKARELFNFLATIIQ